MNYRVADQVSEARARPPEYVLRNGFFVVEGAIGAALIVGALALVVPMAGVGVTCVREAVASEATCVARESGWFGLWGSEQRFRGAPDAMRVLLREASEDTTHTLLQVGAWTSRPLMETAAPALVARYQQFVADPQALAWRGRAPGSWLMFVFSPVLLLSGAVMIWLMRFMVRDQRITLDHLGDLLVVEQRYLWRPSIRTTRPLSKIDDATVESVDDSDFYDLTLHVNGAQSALLRASHDHCVRAAAQIKAAAQRARDCHTAQS